MNKIIGPWSIVAGFSIFAKVYYSIELAKFAKSITSWQASLGRLGEANKQMLGKWETGLDALIAVSLVILAAATVWVIKDSLMEKHNKGSLPDGRA